MTKKLAEECKKIGLELNAGKTKWMAYEGTKASSTNNIEINGVTIQRVKEFVYLGQLLQIPRDHKEELKRRIGSAWRVFGKAKTFLCSKNIAMCLKRRYFNTCILPALLYGSETWTLTKAGLTRLVRTQRAMERWMLGVRLRDKKPSDWIRSITKLKDVTVAARKRKWRFTEKMLSRKDDRWTVRLTLWTPSAKRPLGRPRTRWEDEIRKHIGIKYAEADRTWTKATENTKRWKDLERTFTVPYKPAKTQCKQKTTGQQPDKPKRLQS
jgi:hypothetical protein